MNCNKCKYKDVCIDGMIINENRMCTKYMKKQEYKSILKTIPKRYKDADISKTLIKDTTKSYYLFGSPGIGKTYTAFALLKKIYGYYINERDLFLNIYGKDYRESQVYLSEIIEKEKLYIDDIAAKPLNENRVDIYDIIIDKRYVNNYQTVYISNYSLLELTNRIKKINKLSAEKISGRINESCKILKIDGENRRIK
jgi:DNA replication protein DnaC